MVADYCKNIFVYGTNSLLNLDIALHLDITHICFSNLQN